jgi:hypothetical protein
MRGSASDILAKIPGHGIEELGLSGRFLLREGTYKLPLCEVVVWHLSTRAICHIECCVDVDSTGCGEGGA